MLRGVLIFTCISTYKYKLVNPILYVKLLITEGPGTFDLPHHAISQKEGKTKKNKQSNEAFIIQIFVQFYFLECKKN